VTKNRTETGSPKGFIGRTHTESVPWYESVTKPNASAPNVVFIVLDDVGYSDLGCYGSEIRTPAINQLAECGLRYSNFHTTTLCSSTRACLLTGRNHHAVGMRFLANVDMGWPNGRGAITRRAATLAEVLRDAGYGTYAVGKWHLAPTDDANAAGPFDEWPLGRGFERFYGFMNGCTDQFHPELIHDNHFTQATSSPEQGYHLSEDLVDHAVAFLSDQISLRPAKPFFLWMGLGAGHFPHQAPEAFIDRYVGVFDGGWDTIRQQRFERQKTMGLIPLDTVLPPANPGVVPWANLSAEERRVAIRLQQAYAGFMEHADSQIGRMMDFLARTKRLDNTLVVLLSDNGASVDCGPEGTSNVMRWFNHIPESVAQNLVHLQNIGSPASFSNYPWGWAQVSNTPLKLYKTYTHGGGVRDPLIIHWPDRLNGAGAIRHQFHHAIDLMPTVLEACGVDVPQTYRGVAQMPVHGTSMSYTFKNPDAPTRKAVQYFEMYGHRAIWHKGWKAVTHHRPGNSFETEAWELYHLDADFAEACDLSQSHPGKLKEMVERWWAEAGRYDVQPLDDRRDILFKAMPKPESVRAASRFVFYPPLSPIPAEAAPLTQDVSHRIDVTVRCRADDAGVLLSFGNVHSGYVLFVQNGRLCYGYNYCGEETVLVSKSLVPAGETILSVVFQKTAPLAGRAWLEIDGIRSQPVELPRTLLRISLMPMLVGRSGLPAVVSAYHDAFPFSGHLERIEFLLGNDRDVQLPDRDVD